MSRSPAVRDINLLTETAAASQCEEQGSFNKVSTPALTPVSKNIQLLRNGVRVAAESCVIFLFSKRGHQSGWVSNLFKVQKVFLSVRCLTS